MGIKWEYELEGFVLPSGKYLPDFWLPEIETWFEVKGKTPTKEETRKASELCADSGNRVVIYWGQIEVEQPKLHQEPKSIAFYFAGNQEYFTHSLYRLPSETKVLGKSNVGGFDGFQVFGPLVKAFTHYHWCSCASCGYSDLRQNGIGYHTNCSKWHKNNFHKAHTMQSVAKEIYLKAIQARFEHGETPR